MKYTIIFRHNEDNIEKEVDAKHYTHGNEGFVVFYDDNNNQIMSIAADTIISISHKKE